MKKAFTLSCLLLACCCIYAQAPQYIPYQAVARNSTGIPYPNRFISLRLSVRDSSSGGTVVYKETDTVTTNTFGLFTINIGLGTVVTGTFTGINWSNGLKYLQVEIDTSGGSSYVNTGTMQMLSVPYALYASNSGNGISVPVSRANGGTILGLYGGWDSITRFVISSSTPTVGFTGLNSTYTAYKIIFSGLTGNNIAGIRLGTGSTPTYYTGSSDYLYTITNQLGGAGNVSSSYILLGGIGATSGDNMSGEFTLYQPSQSAIYPNINGHETNFSSSQLNDNNISANLQHAVAVTAIELLVLSGDFYGGTITLYGIH